jgi:predicted GTPase
MARTVLIMGAAGRDFHNFNVRFRDNADYEVACFTAAQIPDIAGRMYPPELAGELYPEGIPIHPEDDMPKLIRDHKIDLVVFSYSDVSYAEIMHKASLAASQGADFCLLDAASTMIASSKPVITVCAVRTGCGKSQTSRKVCELVSATGRKVVVVRHPMPYGDLAAQAVQRFSRYEDFAEHKCTIEEREEYEPLVDEGIIVYAGVDYERILREAEKEADVIVWDGGNNDTTFYRSKVYITVFDPLRAGHELEYYPGETNMRLADIAVVNKVLTAQSPQVERVKHNIAAFGRPDVDIVLAESAVVVEKPELIRDKRVLVVEDGPTLTHGGMPFGAGVVAARTHGAAELVDPRPHAAGSIKSTYGKYAHIESVLPAMGYGDAQMKDLEATINRTDCDLVLFATPINLTRLLSIERPAVRVRYEYRDHGSPTLEEALTKRMA